MKAIRIRTRDPYDVLIGEGIAQKLGLYLTALPGKRYRKAVVVCDETTWALCGAQVCESLDARGLETCVFEFPPGESSKTMDTVQDLLELFHTHRMSPSDLVVALGDGVAASIAGFAAAIYLHGVDYVLVATTMLTAIDSTTGGSVSVHLPAGQNLAALHHAPVLALCDTAVIRAQGIASCAEGLVEAVKYGCTRDVGLFSLLETADPRRNAVEIIARSVEARSHILHHQDLAAVRGFGAPITWGVEKASRFRLSHGKSTSIGMSITADACAKNGILDPRESRRIKAVLQRMGLPTKCRYKIEDLCREACTDRPEYDPVSLVVLRRIGRAGVYPVRADQLPGFFIA